MGLVVGSRCTAHQCEILELEGKVGGHVHRLVVDGYTFDLGGPHILFSNNKEILALLDRSSATTLRNVVATIRFGTMGGMSNIRSKMDFTT